MRKPLIIRDLTAEIPVIQGGMGVGISLSGLAGSVAACGGVGVISTAQIGYQEPGFQESPIETNLKAIGKQLRRARELSKGKGIIGVNIMVATRRYEDYVKAAVKAKADIIISGAGLPVNLPKLVEKSKTKIAPVVSSVKSADVIFKLWDRKYHRCADLVVIEGPKAGGHLGFSYEQLKQLTGPGGEQEYEAEITKILELTKEYSEKYQYEIPVVMAGGIYEKKDMDHYLQLGLAGVQLATRFVTTYECDATMKYKQAYLNASKEDIKIVKSPVGMPGRAIRNAFIEKTETESVRLGKCLQCLAHCDRARIPYCITEALVNAAEGKTNEALIFCGTNAWRAEKLEHVEDIMREFE